MSKDKDLFLVMYHGVLTSGRGIETLIELVSQNKNIYGIILGSGQPTYVNGLHELVEKSDVKSRILFHEAVNISELWKYVGAVDLSLMMIQGDAKSYYYALPNKFFESIQALTPIVASNFPEMKRLIDRYEIGLTCDPTNMDEINACVERMRTDSEFYDRCKRNLVKAKEELCWENEKQVLISAYKQIVR